MATNTEQIQQLNKLVAGLEFKVEVIQELRSEVKKLADDLQQQGRELAALKQTNAHLEKQVDRLVQQRFTIWIAFAGAVFGSLLTFGSQLLIRFLSR